MVFELVPFNVIGHLTTEDKKNSKTENKVCVYPICREKGHALKCCKSLHSLCFLCKRRGHYAKDHNYFDLRFLEVAFLKYAPGGMLTSIPFLEMHPKMIGRVGETRWRFGLYNDSRSASFKFLKMMGID